MPRTVWIAVAPSVVESSAAISIKAHRLQHAQSAKVHTKKTEITIASSVVVSSTANAIQDHRLQHAPNGEARTEKDINSDPESVVMWSSTTLIRLPQQSPRVGFAHYFQYSVVLHTILRKESISQDKIHSSQGQLFWRQLSQRQIQRVLLIVLYK